MNGFGTHTEHMRMEDEDIRIIEEQERTRQMTRIEEGQKIINDLLSDGVDQWNAKNVDGDDWACIGILSAERDFASSVIERLTDDAEDTALIIVTVLMRSARATFAEITINWSDDRLAGVPAIVSGLAKAEAWLKEGENGGL